MTGLDPQTHGICEVGLAWGTAGQLEGTWSALVRPRGPLDTEARHIHGLGPEELADAPAFAEVLPALRARLEGSDVVAHAAAVDRSFLMAALARLGAPPLDVRWHDSLEVARAVLALSRHRLDDVCEACGVPRTTTHRARHDAEATLRAWWRLLELVDPDARLDDEGLAARLGELGPRSPWRRAMGRRLREAAAARRAVRLTYVSRDEDGRVYLSDREVELWRVRLPRLEGLCLLRSEPRIFRLDRIHDVQVLDRTYVVPVGAGRI
ncbi:MAG: WYL domain-containing protein [Alphaproteobacteria bacterium]|nr:WYL domain-containing protein [Alphaproteobacteria bacterium]